MKKKSFISVLFIIVFLFGFVCEGFSQNPADSEIEQILRTKSIESKAKAADTSWTSGDPEDFSALTGTTWEFTYTLDEYTYTDTLIFEKSVQTSSDGSVILSYYDQYEYEGGVIYTELPSEVGGGYGFFAVITTEYFNQIYIFKVSGDTAAGYYMMEYDGEYSDPYPMTGKKINNSVETGWVKISGTVQNNEGTSLCAMILANGEYMFSCDANNGIYELDVPLDADGNITLFAFCDGLAPFKKILTSQKSETFNISMQPASSDSRYMNITAALSETASGWVKISGTVQNDEGTPLCAMILANGEYMFSCDANQGKYELEVPLDSNGEITLFGFCDGLQPYKKVLSPGHQTQTPSQLAQELSQKSSSVVDANEKFILASQAYFADTTEASLSEIIQLKDDYIAKGEELADAIEDYNLTISKLNLIQSSQKQSRDLPGGPAGPIPVTLPLSIREAINNAKVDANNIINDYNSGNISEEEAIARINKAKTQHTLNTVGTGFAAVGGTFASGIAYLGLTAAKVGAVTVGGVAISSGIVITGVGIAAGVGIKMLWNYCSGSKSRESNGTCFMSTFQGETGKPISVPYNFTGSLTIFVEGKGPVTIDNLEVKDGKIIEVSTDPADIDDITWDDLNNPDESVETKENDWSEYSTELVGITATNSPVDPGPGESVSVTAHVIPPLPGIEVYFTISGTDGYSSSGTYTTDSSGNAGSFYIPGASEGVVDTVTITAKDKKTTIIYVF